MKHGNAALLLARRSPQPSDVEMERQHIFMLLVAGGWDEMRSVIGDGRAAETRFAGLLGSRRAAACLKQDTACFIKISVRGHARLSIGSRCISVDVAETCRSVVRALDCG